MCPLARPHCECIPRVGAAIGCFRHARCSTRYFNHNSTARPTNHRRRRHHHHCHSITIARVHSEHVCRQAWASPCSPMLVQRKHGDRVHSRGSVHTTRRWGCLVRNAWLDRVPIIAAMTRVRPDETHKRACADHALVVSHLWSCFPASASDHCSAFCHLLPCPNHPCCHMRPKGSLPYF